MEKIEIIYYFSNHSFCPALHARIQWCIWGLAEGMGGNPGGGGGGDGGDASPHDFEGGGHNIKCPPPPTFLM